MINYIIGYPAAVIFWACHYHPMAVLAGVVTTGLIIILGNYLLDLRARMRIARRLADDDTSMYASRVRTIQRSGHHS